MEIILNLDAHCIETGIRKEYNRAVTRFLRNGAFDRQTGRKVEILKFLLENLHFHMIRSKCETYLREKNNHASIVEDAGRLEIFVNGKRVYKGKTAIDED
ncbi:MAG: hypothetical protein K9J83_02460 [Desulfarculaceae bacterium]|nr:hypothetical protein [Desulfarculaceae bacterium]